MDVSPEALRVARSRIRIADARNALATHRRFLLHRKAFNRRFFSPRDAEMLAVVERGIRLRDFQLYLLGGPPLHRKAGFDSNQPRVPAGQTGGGQWTDGGNAGGPLKITIHPLAGEDDGLPLGPAPDIPEFEPLTAQFFNSFVKQAARWLAKAVVREAVAGPVVGTFLNALEAAEWAARGYPFIQSYLDPPKALFELQGAVSSPKRGYDIHHIVERTAAARAGFPDALINDRGNLVRIPTLKHWEITGWYMTKNENFGGLSPRDYLRDKDWAERTRVGHFALVKHGVLRP